MSIVELICREELSRLMFVTDHQYFVPCVNFWDDSTLGLWVLGVYCKDGQRGNINVKTNNYFRHE